MIQVYFILRYFKLLLYIFSILKSLKKKLEYAYQYY